LTIRRSASKAPAALPACRVVMLPGCPAATPRMKEKVWIGVEI
jgi:hypothetical protein